MKKLTTILLSVICPFFILSKAHGERNFCETSDSITSKEGEYVKVTFHFDEKDHVRLDKEKSKYTPYAFHKIPGNVQVSQILSPRVHVEAEINGKKYDISYNNSFLLDTGDGNYYFQSFGFHSASKKLHDPYKEAIGGSVYHVESLFYVDYFSDESSLRGYFTTTEGYGKLKRHKFYIGCAYEDFYPFFTW